MSDSPDDDVVVQTLGGVESSQVRIIAEEGARNVELAKSYRIGERVETRMEALVGEPG